jgi:hypothetical protein
MHRTTRSSSRWHRSGPPSREMACSTPAMLMKLGVEIAHA